jgi:bifunctional non-homologous end joining protein LigD
VDEVYRQSHSRTSTTSACRPLVRSTDQLYAGIHTTDVKHPSAYAKALAEHLAAQTPTWSSRRWPRTSAAERCVDWSQNNPAKTTIAPYSLRGRARPTVSTPITWDEVRACRQPEQLVFTADDVLDRVEHFGDLFASIPDTRAELPAR